MTRLHPSKLISVLRWIAILPSCYFLAVLATVPVRWAVRLIPHYGSRASDGSITIEVQDIPLVLLEKIPSEVLEAFLHAFSTPLIVITVGAIIAPSFIFHTGIALAIIWGFVFGISVANGLQQSAVYFAWGWLGFTLTCVFGACGVTLGLYWAHSLQHPKPNPLDVPFTASDAARFTLPDKNDHHSD